MLTDDGAANMALHASLTGMMRARLWVENVRALNPYPLGTVFLCAGMAWRSGRVAHAPLRVRAFAERWLGHHDSHTRFTHTHMLILVLYREVAGHDNAAKHAYLSAQKYVAPPLIC